MEFSRSEYWSGQPFPSPGDLPNPGIKPRSSTLEADSLPAEPIIYHVIWEIPPNCSLQIDMEALQSKQKCPPRAADQRCGISMIENE